MSSAPDASSSIAIATGFAAGLLDPESPPPVFLTGPGGKLATRRYAVYRNNVVMGLGSALEEIFPAVRRIVGDAFFAGMARLYLRRHPPSSPLLFAYGADFPTFVEDFEPARALPYLADVARIERAWLDAFHAADAPSVDGGFFGSASPDELDELRFAPHPALRILRSEFAAHTIFEANRGDAPPEPIDASRPETCMITRPGLTVVARRVAPADAAFIETLAQGESLSAAIGVGFECHPGFEPAAAIGLLLESGSLCPLVRCTSAQTLTPNPEGRP